MSTDPATSAAVAHQRTMRFAAADPDAIRAVYQTYGRLVYAVAYRILGEVSLAEDAVEQTFVRAWRRAGTEGASQALGLRMATIARHVALDLLDHASVSSAPSLEQIYEVWEVRQALQNLPAQDRELIRLQQHGELSHTDIAAELSIPPASVPAHNLRAHRHLAGLLDHVRTAT